MSDSIISKVKSKLFNTDTVTVGMGNMVKDKVSGFKGIVVSEHNYLNGCTRLTVQPPVNDKGELPGVETFDVPQLELVLAGVAENEPLDGRTGGTSKYEDKGR